MLYLAPLTDEPGIRSIANLTARLSEPLIALVRDSRKVGERLFGRSSVEMPGRQDLFVQSAVSSIPISDP